MSQLTYTDAGTFESWKQFNNVTGGVTGSLVAQYDTNARVIALKTGTGFAIQFAYGFKRNYLLPISTLNSDGDNETFTYTLDPDDKVIQIGVTTSGVRHQTKVYTYNNDGDLASSVLSEEGSVVTRTDYTYDGQVLYNQSIISGKPSTNFASTSKGRLEQTQILDLKSGSSTKVSFGYNYKGILSMDIQESHQSDATTAFFTFQY